MNRLRRVSMLRGANLPAMVRRRPKLWALGSLAVLVLLVVVLVVGRRYTLQQIDVDRQIRVQLIPALEKEIGEKIEIGRIESDYFSRIDLYDVVIGRDPESPLGALARARRITIYIDAVGLVLRRQDPLQSISRVVAEGPQILLLRDARGQLNISDMFRAGTGEGTQWDGVIEVSDGRVYYRDEIIVGASGERLLVDARGVDGVARFAGAEPMRYEASVERALVGNRAVPLQNLGFQGTFAANGRWFTLDARWPSAPAALLADYAFRGGEVVARAGTIGGRALVMWDASLPREQQFITDGTLDARGVAGFARALQEPGTTRPLPIADISGPLAFTGTTLETSGITARALDTPLRMAGALKFTPLTFDVRVASNAFNTPRLLTAARAMNRSPEFQATRIQAGIARGTIHATGDINEWNARGQLAAPSVSLAHPRLGTARASTPNVNFVLRSGLGQQMQISAEVAAGSAAYSAQQAGNWRAAGGVRGSFRWSNASRQPLLQLRANAGSLAGQSTQWGAWRADDAAISARSAGSRLTGQVNTTKLAGRHPQLGVLGARNLRANISSASDGASDIAAEITAASAVGSGATVEVARGLNWQSGALQSSLRWRDGRGAASISSANLRARQPALGAANTGNLQGNVSWTSAGGATTFGTRFDARNANIQNPQAGSWRLARLTGAASGRSTQRATQIQTDVEARNFTGSHRQYGAWQGNAARVSASTSDATRGGWTGTAALGNTDVSRVNMAALSPALAQQVRGAGVLTAKGRFTDLGGSDPVVRGRARLSQITLRQGGQSFPLRNVDTQIAFGNDQLRLANLQAQSEYGVINADVQSQLSTGSLRLTAVAPRVVLTEEQIAPLLADSGIQWQGRATGRLRIATTGQSTAGGNPVLQTSFDFALPTARVLIAQPNGPPTPVRAGDARVRGAGTVRFTSGENWQYTGTAALNAAHLVHATPQTPAPDSRAAGLRVAAEGTVSRSATGITTRLSGEASADSLLVPIDERERFAFQDVRAQFVARPDEIQLARLQAGAGDGSELLGHATLRRASAARYNLSGQLLVERFDAARGQHLLQTLQADNADSSQLPQFSGVLFARADFDGVIDNAQLTLNDVGLQARLYRGEARWPNLAVPIDAARLTTNLQLPLRDQIPLDQLVVWSEGGRLSASGTITPQEETLALDLNATVNTMRVQNLLNSPTGRTLEDRPAVLDEVNGLLSGQVRITGTATQPHVEGRTALRLADVFGVDIEEVQGDLLVQTAVAEGGQPQFRVALTNITGQAEGARFTGDLRADSGANLWTLVLNTGENLATNRLLSTSGTGANEQLRLWRDLPLRGEVGGSVNLSGTLFGEDGTAQLAATDGTILLQTGALRWRGEELGELTADLRLQDGALQARAFDLHRVATEEEERARLRIAGVLPVSLDSPTLDATVTVENEQLSFVLEVLTEISSSLAERGQNVAYLQTIQERLQGLPRNVDGRFDMLAQLEQSWRVPVVDVRLLQATDISFATATGGRQRLPDVTTRFVYDGNDNGAITIRSAELRLPPQTEPGATEASATDTEGGDELLIRTLQPGRIVPGGDLSLTVEILNADLQQLAEWVPALRNAQGQPVVRGRLSDFVVALAGTTNDPTVTGSLQGEDWEYRGYTLDQVRLDQFTIAGGQLRVEPGFLTVVKGEFQSSAAWGFLPWTWGDETESPGISFIRPLEIHLPIDADNFGALTGIFVPQITTVGAEDFVGNFTVGGTVNNPTLAGGATVTNGQFRFRSTLAEFDAGVTNLNGEVRVVDGNRLEIGGEGITGQLVPANQVQARATGNEPARQRETRANRRQANDPPDIAGNFALRGAVAFNLDPDLLEEPRLALAAHRYDLSFSLVQGRYATATFTGVRDLNMAAILRTGAGAPQLNQQLRWALGATGDGRRDEAGSVLSFASLALPPNFATGFDAALRSRAVPFSGIEDFAALPGVADNPVLLTALQVAEGQLGRFALDDFRFNWSDVARGVVNGVLTLDNLPSAPPPAPPFAPPRTPPLATQVSTQPALWDRSESTRARMIQSETAPANSREPLRISGRLTLTQAELYGPPAPREERAREVALDDTPAGSTDGVLARLPDAPRLDIKLVVGRDVQFVSSNLRATIDGDIDVGGTPYDPIVFGTLFTRSGTITFPNARARLESGEITITARRDAYTNMLRTRVEIDATARGRSGRYEITLRLRGPLDTGEGSTQDLRIDISSNPPLSSDEAFEQLLGVAALNREGGNEQEAYARAIVGLLSGPLFAGLERSLERTLGLDSIMLDYRIDEPIAIEVGKAIGDRLYITYRRALSNTPTGPTPFNLRIDYRLRGDIQVGLETDETSTHRLTIHKTWRF